MRAVILAGGEGTRLAPYNTIFPKPLVPLGERPILDILIHQLAHYGFDDITLSLGYLAELIQAYFRDGSPTVDNAKIHFVREDKPLGTVGSLKLLPSTDESFLVMNGDVLTTLDFGALFKHHCESDSELTIATQRKQVKLDLGVMEMNADNELVGFREKPEFDYLVSMGVYVYKPSALDYITKGEHLDLPDIVHMMLRDKRKIVGYPSDDYWLDLGSHVDYGRAQDEFEQMRHQLIPGE
jgi:NDP-sugar pyrophosphorylase family protein